MLEGPGIELRLVPEAGGGVGIREVLLRVAARPGAAGEHRFGPRSVLRLAGKGLATWSF